MKHFWIVLFILLLNPAIAFDDGLEQALFDIEPELESLSFALADAQWTHDDMFEGKVVIFSVKGHLGASESEGVDENGYKTQYYLGSFSNDTQIGEEGLEISTLRVAAITAQKVKELESDGKIHILEKGFMIANMQLTRDKPLAQAA